MFKKAVNKYLELINNTSNPFVFREPLDFQFFP